MKTTSPNVDCSSQSIIQFWRLLAIAAGVFLFQTAQAVVSLPYYDGFDYSEGNLFTVAAGVWDAGGNTGSEITVANAATLTAPPGFAAETGKGVRWSPSGTARRAAVQFTSVANTDNNTVYASFLLNVQTAPTASKLIAFIDDSGSSTTTPQLGIFLDSGPKLGVGKSATTPGSAMATNLGSGTHLVVVRYTFKSSGNDLADFWVDPSSSDYGAGAAPTPLGGTNGGSDPSLLDFFLINTPSGLAGGGLLFIDEFRVGTTWADVVPSGGPLTGVRLGFTTQPANAAVNATMSPVIVQVQSSAGASVASNGVPITLTLTGGSGTLNGTLTQNTDSSGKATFNDLSIDTAGTGKELTASASGIGTGLTNAVSATFSITNVPLGKKLAFTTQPADTQVNATMSAVVVQIQDENGISAASNNVPITLTLTSGSGTLNGTTTQNTDASGKATFNNLSLDTAGAGKQLTASASGIGTGLTNAVSITFTITTPPGATKLGFTTQPADAIVNATMSAVVVQIQQSNGTSVSSNNVPITLTLTSGSGTLNGTTTQNTDSSGKATFSNLSIDTAGVGKQLTASASGIGTGLTNAVSSTFSILNSPPPNGPIITQAVKTVSSIILRGTNGTPSGNYAVLNSTNLALLTTQWASIATNTFDLNGNFDCTNSVLSSDARNFYRLMVVASSVSDQGSNGYATVGMTITGGGDTTNIITVTNLAGFIAAASNNPTPAIILLKSNLTLSPNGDFFMGANKTIIGVGTNVTISGDLAIYGTQEVSSPATNIIIRNIIFTNPGGVGEGDGLTIKYGSHHVWVDHCTFVDCSDGTVDVTREGDFVTVSWCKFYYTVRNNHEDANLIGADDSHTGDNGKLHVTFHHNWWSKICRERMPSVRYGRVHVYNNYYETTAPGVLTNNYCVRARLYSEVLVENNYFDGVHNPWELATSDAGPNGKLFASGNITNNCTFSANYDAELPNNGIVIIIPGTDTLTPAGTDPIGLNPPPYPYTLDLAANIPNIVTNNAGAGKGPFAP